MNTREQYLDILDAISNNRNKLLLGNTVRSKLFRKLLILRKFVKGQTEVSRTFWSLLPISMRPQRFRLEDDLDFEIIFKSIIGNYSKEPLRLFDYDLYYLSEIKMKNNLQYQQFFTCIGLIEEIIIMDQYCLKEFIKESPVVIDAGANIGVFSLYASHLSPEGQIYSFEPTRSTFQILKKNILNNNLQNRIFAHNLALGDKEGENELMIYDTSLGGGNTLKDSEFLQNRTKLFTKKENIKIMTIDSFVEQNKLDKVNFIKIDTEGYEKQILQGARETIKKFSPVIACSAYHLKDDKIKIPELVQSIDPNYSYRLLKRAEEDIIFWR